MFKKNISIILFIMVLLSLFSGMNVFAEVNTSEPYIELDCGEKYNIDIVNNGREADKLAVYTSVYIKVYGTDFTPVFDVSSVSEAVIVNDIVVSKNESGQIKTLIPTNGVVLSGMGDKKFLIDRLQVGQTVKIINLNAGTTLQRYFKFGDKVFEINKVNNGWRGAGEIVVYTPSWGASTKTNPWGLELAVVNGKVTNIVPCATTGNCSIPKDGIVISINIAHSSIELLKTIQVGDSIEVVLDSLYNAAKIEYDAMNPKTREDNPIGWDAANNRPYPSFRGPDQLIIYDSSYGYTTGTNPWGYEVRVNKDGIVIGAGGNDSIIPEGGYVLSGIGTKATPLSKSNLVGAKVKIDNNTKSVLLILTPEAYLTTANLLINTKKDDLKRAREEFRDVSYSKVQSVIDQAYAVTMDAQNDFYNYNYISGINKIKQLDGILKEAVFENMEVWKVERRAVWLRPYETNITEVRTILDKLKKANINTIYLESWWNGYTSFVTENQITTLNPIHKGFDVLKAYTELAKEYGMEIHAWVENNFIGVGSVDQGGPVARKNPEWLMRSRSGSDRLNVPVYNTYFYFANPALPEVRDFVSELYKEIVKKYDIKGMHLDYIRFPEPNGTVNGVLDDFGYDEYTKNLYKTARNIDIDPVEITPEHELWKDWCKFRADLINTFVYRAVSEAKSIKPDIKITSDIWANFDDAPYKKMQEARDWASKGYMDSLIPMSYYGDLKPVKAETQATLDVAGGLCSVTTGLGVTAAGNFEMLSGQIVAVRDLGADGVSFFDKRVFLEQQCEDNLGKSIFRSPAIVPDNDPALTVKTVLSEINRKIDQVYIPNQGINQTDAQELKSLINKIMLFIPEGETKLNKVSKLKDLINTINDKTGELPSVKTGVADRIRQDINICNTVLGVLISKYEFMENQSIDKFVVELPKDYVMNSEIPVKVKGIIQREDHVAEMYLDPSQYSITSENPDTVEVVNNNNIIIKKDERACLIIKINDNFKLNIKNESRNQVLFIEYPKYTLASQQSVIKEQQK